MSEQDISPRPEVNTRFYRVFTYQDVDRVADLEFGYWPQTIRRWLKEGLPLDLTEEEQNNMFCPRLDEIFGLDDLGFGLHLRLDMNPSFETKILERKEDSVIIRDFQGVIAERFENKSDGSSIPHFIKFPIETPDDWAAIKQRYRLDDPCREIPREEADNAVAAASEGRAVTICCCGFYGQLRNWMGFENLSLAFYEYPDMIHDMVEHWAELCAQQIEQLGDDVIIDMVSWWEDMAGKNGPFVGPQMFREFIQPGYHRVMTAAKKHGCGLGIVDCDGDPHDIIGNWLEEGVNIMFPIEVTASVDTLAWREEFGKELRMRGGIDKKTIALGGSAIDDELERIKPLLDQGGFVPHLDHLVPPDISYDNYREYRDKQCKLIGK